MSDANLLVLFGTVLGMIGSIFLSIDALGAQDFLASLDKEKDKPFQTTQIGFFAIINNIFVYLVISAFGFFVLLMLSQINIVLSLLLAPFVYFAWSGIIYLSEKVVNLVGKLGPRKLRKDEKSSCLFLIVQLVHGLIWAIPFALVSIIALIIKFGLDIPLRMVSEKLVAPFVKRLYQASAKLVAEDIKWHLKRMVLIGTLFLLFGFIYQFIGVILVIKW